MIRNPDRIGVFDFSGCYSLSQDIIAQQFGQARHRQLVVAVPEKKRFPAVGICQIDAADVIKVAGITQGFHIGDEMLVRFRNPSIPAFFQRHIEHQLYIRDAHIQVAVLRIKRIIFSVSAVQDQTVAGEVQHHRCRISDCPSGPGAENRSLSCRYGKILPIC